MHDVIYELNCKREKLGYGWKDIAIRTQRDQNVIIRQFADDSNPTLESLESIAHALGGSIHFFPDDWTDIKKECSDLRTNIGRLERENELLLDRLSKADALLDKRMKKIDDLQSLLTKVIEKLMDRV